MAEARFYCSSLASGSVEIVGQEARHISKVKRGRVGDVVELFDGAGRLAKGTISQIDSGKVVLAVEEVRTIERRVRGRIVIAVSLAKGERLHWLLSKCTELGVDRVSAMVCERTVKQGSGPKVIDRYERVAVEAAKQSRGVFVPRVDGPKSLTETLAGLRGDYPEGKILVGSPSEQDEGSVEGIYDGSDVLVFVGPEGGFSAEEEQLLRECGARRVRLSETVLRIETAAVTFAAVLSWLRTVG